MSVSMGGGVSGNGSIPILEAMLSFTHQRQTLLVNNIANLNTPNFRAKDLPVSEFQALLKEALNNRSTGASPIQLPTGGSIKHAEGGGFEGVPVFRQSGVTRHDGNNVSIDVEMNELLKNALTAQTLNKLLAGKYGGLQKAIKGTVT